MFNGAWCTYMNFCYCYIINNNRGKRHKDVAKTKSLIWMSRDLFCFRNNESQKLQNKLARFFMLNSKTETIILLNSKIL